AHQALDVRVRRVALIRRRLDAIDGQRGEQQRLSSEWIIVAGENRAAVAVHLRREALEAGIFYLACLGGGESDTGWRGFLATNGLLASGHPAIILQLVPVRGEP